MPPRPAETYDIKRPPSFNHRLLFRFVAKTIIHIDLIRQKFWVISKSRLHWILFICRTDIKNLQFYLFFIGYDKTLSLCNVAPRSSSIFWLTCSILIVLVQKLQWMWKASTHYRPHTHTHTYLHSLCYFQVIYFRCIQNVLLQVKYQLLLSLPRSGLNFIPVGYFIHNNWNLQGFTGSNSFNQTVGSGALIFK